MVYHRDSSLPLMNESAVWGGFTFLVGFLVVFRTSISYSRFWDGMTSSHRMRAEWFDACASICAFCKHSSEPQKKIEEFQHTLIRLFSLLHAVALAQIEDSNSEDPLNVEAFSLGLIDDCFLDDQSLLAIRETPAKPELAFQWIQQLIVENIKTGVLSIPPPILSRAFQELANGMVEFHEALKVSSVPFPFPYAQCCDFLLVVHAMMTPVVISQWVNDAFWAMAFCFLQLCIMWSLRFIAIELENPFGMDANDLDQQIMHEEMNHHLALLVHPACKRTPTLQYIPPSASSDKMLAQCHSKRSLNAAWEQAFVRKSTLPSQIPEDSLGASSDLPVENPGRTSRRSSRRSSVTTVLSTMSRMPAASARKTVRQAAKEMREQTRGKSKHSTGPDRWSYLGPGKAPKVIVTDDCQRASLSGGSNIEATGFAVGTVVGDFGEPLENPETHLGKSREATGKDVGSNGEALGRQAPSIDIDSIGQPLGLDPIMLEFAPRETEERLHRQRRDAGHAVCNSCDQRVEGHKVGRQRLRL